MSKSTNITLDTGDGPVVIAQVFDPVCDWCNTTLKDEPGGGLYCNGAVCPECWEKHKIGDGDDFTGCPPDVGLATWIKDTCW